MRLAKTMTALAGKLEADAAGIRRRCATASRHRMNPMRSEAAALERAGRLIRAALPQHHAETTTMPSLADLMPSLADLIETHDAALKRLNAACDLIDSVLAAEQGRTVTLEDQNEWDRAEEAEDAAMQAVLSHRCANMSEISTKAAYLLSIRKAMDGLDQDRLELLLRSLISAIEIDT